MNSYWLAPLVVVSVSLAPALARADGPVRAALVLAPCPVAGVAEPELRALLDLELRSAKIDLVDPKSDALEDLLLEVRTSCDASGEIVVRALRESELRERSLSLSDLPEHTRTRALALALSGLVEGLTPEQAPEEAAITLSESDAQPEAKPQPQPKPRPKAPARPTPEQQRAELAELDRTTPTRSPESRFAFSVRPEMRWFMGGQPLWGGRIAQSFNLLTVGVGVLSGSTVETSSGSISVNSFQGFLALRVAEAKLGHDVSIIAEPRVGAGTVNVQATPFDGSIGQPARELLLDAALLTLFELRGQSFRTGLGLELGAARGVVATADGQPAVTFDGVFASVLLSLGFPL